MRVGVLGINHKLAGLKLREQLAKTGQRRLAPGSSVHCERSLVFLSTCNRTEIYFSSDDLAATHSYLLNILRQDVEEEFDQKLYSYFGQDCLSHLCRVTTGLDSAIIAETEIQGQVKTAYEDAQDCNSLPFELHYLFQKALKISKQVRAVLPVTPGLPDVEHAVFQTGQTHFKTMLKPRILFVGASDINQKTLAYFVSRRYGEITLCNRTLSRGKEMAEKYQISHMDWEWLVNWPSYDWIILGTKSTSHLLRSQDIQGPIRNKLIIDLSMPRNADPMLAHHAHIELVNIDQINQRLQNRREYLLESLDLAEQMISQAIPRQVSLFYEKERMRADLCSSSA